MIQKKLDKNKSNDEYVNLVLIKSVDDQLENLIHQKEVLKKQDGELNMRINQLNFQRKNLIKKGWRKAL